MSDGSTAGVSVTWSATGGTITTGGLYTAGTTAGTFRVIAIQQGGTRADTSSVTITVPAPTLTAVELTPASVSLDDRCDAAVHHRRPHERRQHVGGLGELLGDRRIDHGGGPVHGGQRRRGRSG